MSQRPTDIVLSNDGRSVHVCLDSRIGRGIVQIPCLAFITILMTLIIPTLLGISGLNSSGMFWCTYKPPIAKMTAIFLLSRRDIWIFFSIKIAVATMEKSRRPLKSSTIPKATPTLIHRPGRKGLIALRIGRHWKLSTEIPAIIQRILVTTKPKIQNL